MFGEVNHEAHENNLKARNTEFLHAVLAGCACSCGCEETRHREERNDVAISAIGLLCKEKTVIEIATRLRRSQ